MPESFVPEVIYGVPVLGYLKEANKVVYRSVARAIGIALNQYVQRDGSIKPPLTETAISDVFEGLQGAVITQLFILHQSIEDWSSLVIPIGQVPQVMIDSVYPGECHILGLENTYAVVFGTEEGRAVEPFVTRISTELGCKGILGPETEIDVNADFWDQFLVSSDTALQTH